jgi:hypothetical protein
MPITIPAELKQAWPARFQNYPFELARNNSYVFALPARAGKSLNEASQH